MRTRDTTGLGHPRWGWSLGLMGWLGGVGMLGCEARGDDWNASVSASDAIGLEGSIVLQDEELERLVFVTVDEQEQLATTSFGVGQNVVAVRPSADGRQLFVLSRGVFPRIEESDEGPQLQVFDGGSEPKLAREPFELGDPMTELALDPEGEWVAAYAGDATVTNPNELVLLSLKGKDKTPETKTIRSFGGSPVELIFTEALEVPKGGARRFMVVRTDRDVTLVDLQNLERSEVTVRLPEREDGSTFAPAQIAVDDGDPDDDSDARVAVRLENSSDVMLLQLGPSENENKDFSVIVNIVDVGGIPTSIDFVRTDGGLRLAALVPNQRVATLVDPETTLAETVELPHAYNQMTRITSVVGELPEDGDVALLWGAGKQIAFWSLGETAATPYRSIDSTELPIDIARVIDVPSPNEHLKVLEGSGATGFFVLDLIERQSFPLNTRGAGFEVQASRDGKRLWVTNQGERAFSAVELEDLDPLQLYVSEPIGDLFDVERAGGGRSAVALHFQDGWAATVLDAENPSSSKTKYFGALHLEGLQ